jgi:hypothetical protein
MEEGRTADGLPYHFHVYSRRRNSGSVLQLWVDTPNSFFFQINSETGIDRTAKQLGVSREIQTGDAEFDRRFYITAHDEEAVRLMLQDAEARAAMQVLSDAGFIEIYQRKKRLGARMVYYVERHSDLNFDGAVAALYRIARSAEKVAPYAQHEQPLGEFMSRSVHIFAAIFLICSVLVWIFGSSSYPVLDGKLLFRRSLGFCLTPLLVFLLTAFFALRERSTSHRELLLLFFVSLVSFPALFYGGCSILNGSYDNSQPQSHRQIVQRKWWSSGKHGRRYHIAVASWRQGHASEQFSLPYSSYQHLVPDQSAVVIVTRAGHLGFEWMVARDF